ncbi:MAG: methylmalonyl Co-A mutase-associated GTPase MeaB [Bacteroidetes bacterium]|jgi:LAO/AO transport system kinase|nr:methylmalonyl Co-A mutase-associated GTPase MeaB [Bacteroidota bacterium]
MNDDESKKGALHVNQGIKHPESINKNAIANFKGKRKKLSVNDYVEGIIKGNHTVLSQAITLIESIHPDHYNLAQEIIEKCLPHCGHSVRVGITGVPGVGKSTFIEALGNNITSQQANKLAVLAVDPSSEKTKGSILGDKTRMEKLSGNPHVFIRPSPSAGSLGGVARKTRETILLCESAGYNTIFVETVGVGQSETMVHSMVDFFLLLLLAGAGDELQGIKRGIMEMADLIAITKSDKGNQEKALMARQEYENALHLFPPAKSGWIPKVLTCSAVQNEGIDLIWQGIMEYIQFVQDNGYFDRKRSEQAKFWMYETIHNTLRERFYAHPEIAGEIAKAEKDVLDGKQTSFLAAKKLLNTYFGKKD